MPKPVSESTIGFIGLGQMGQAMANNLLQEHGQLVVCDHDPKRSEPLLAKGAERANLPQELARACDTVFLCVPGASESEAVLFGDTGLLSGHQPGDPVPVIVDTTTMPTAKAVALAQKVSERGNNYYDCPVSGLPKRAIDGTLTMMFGGDKTAFARLKPLLDTMGNDAVYCGEIGSGQSMKSVNNIIYNINIAALCEIIPLALKSGLNADAVTEVVLNGSSRSFASGHFVPKMRAREFGDDFAMQSAYKDIENFQVLASQIKAAQAQDSDIGFPVTGAMTQVYEAALAEGHGESAKSSMLKLYEASLGVEFVAD